MWRIFLIGIILGTGQQAWAAHEFLVMKATGHVKVCRQKCQSKGSWTSLPRHHVLSKGDWVKLAKGSVMVYRMVASSSRQLQITGPKTFRLRVSRKVTLSRKLARLWRAVIRRLRGRSSTGVGATRAVARIKRHPAFVDLLSPRNEERLQAPSQLRWRQRKGITHYEVRLFTLSADGAEKNVRLQQLRCHTPTCALSLARVALTPGVKYFWQVRLLQGKKARHYGPYPTYGVYFRLLPKARAVRLRRQLATVGSGSSAQQRWLQQALLYLKAGCFGEGLAALRQQKTLSAALRTRLRDAVACARCQPWRVSREQRRYCRCDDDPGRPLSQ